MDLTRSSGKKIQPSLETSLVSPHCEEPQQGPWDPGVLVFCALFVAIRTYWSWVRLSYRVKKKFLTEQKYAREVFLLSLSVASCWKRGVIKKLRKLSEKIWGPFRKLNRQVLDVVQVSLEVLHSGDCISALSFASDWSWADWEPFWVCTISKAWTRGLPMLLLWGLEETATRQVKPWDVEP